MEKLDRLILKAIGEKVFTPDRVALMLKEFRQRLKDSRSKHDEELHRLKKELDSIEQATDRLYEAIEHGLLPMDITLRRSRQSCVTAHPILARNTCGCWWMRSEWSDRKSDCGGAMRHWRGYYKKLKWASAMECPL